MRYPEDGRHLPCGCLRQHGCLCSRREGLVSQLHPTEGTNGDPDCCSTHEEDQCREIRILVSQQAGKAEPLMSPTDTSGLIHVPSESILKEACAESFQDLSPGPSTPSLLEAQEPLLALQDDETEPQAPPDDMRAGMLWYFSSSFFFAGMGICSKFLGNWGYPVFEITFFRSIIIACFSLSALSSADANTFTFLAPLIVALLSPMVLKERISPATMLTIPLCLCGVLLITQPAFLFGRKHQQFSALAICIGLLQPFFSATAKMTVRVLRITEKMNVIVLYLMMCTFVYSIIGCAFTWKSLVLPASAAEIALLLMQGLFGYGNQICITNGLSKAKAASVMCMQYFSIVLSQLAGMWFFGEFISLWGNVGMVVTVSSMVMYMWVEARSKR